MILQQAETLLGLGLAAKDALHVSCALAAGCTYFVTTNTKSSNA
jgi:predicted nucleic acid-binding protein